MVKKRLTTRRTQWPVIHPEPKQRLVIYVDSAARVEEVEQYLNQASNEVISKTTTPTISWPAALVATGPITTLLDLANQPGVLRIAGVLRSMPQSGNPPQDTKPPRSCGAAHFRIKLQNEETENMPEPLPHQHPGAATIQAVRLRHGPRPRRRGPDLRNDDQRRGEPSTTVADLTGGVCNGIAGLWLGGAVSTTTRTG